MNADANAAARAAAPGPVRVQQMLGTDVILEQVETAVIVVDDDYSGLDAAEYLVRAQQCRY